ncbi:MAG: UDP-N-acetylmuramate--L-alanine ligase [Kiritimatiellae bacterium]|nr:UDP-N-acetylmuramate--L-alanine ligase [Kiritimatiellia bacterium]MDW8458606.1 UDP-N-acetylmuramate--L-alanine ligase [Verrucomicrobiota bacterium]
MADRSPPRWDRLAPAYERACRILAAVPGPVHLLGICGVGMAGLAVLLRGRGHVVSGCDASPSARIAGFLRKRGIEVLHGHDPEHISGNEQFLVRSPAVSESHSEWQAAAAAGRPCFDRGEVLAALVRSCKAVGVSGTHGKTTTTAMLVHILRQVQGSVSFAVGGEIDADGTVADHAPGAPLVFEADESDGTLVLYECEHAVITNVEMDHADFFEDEASLDACFGAFAARVRGETWFCRDDPGAVRAAERAGRPRSYGFEPGAELRAERVECRGLGSAAEIFAGGRRIGSMALRVPGRTNVLNALGAIGASMSLGIDPASAIRALSSFSAVRRRFEVMLDTARATIVSDYAHHPTEIRALVAQAQLGFAPRRLVAVFQPHRYTRTALLGSLFPDAFEGVERVILAPVYAASEPPMPGGSHIDLAEHFVARGRPVEIAESLLDAWDRIRHNWRDGDVLLVVGAGDVEKIAMWAAGEWKTT